MLNIHELKEEAKKYMRYEKDVANKTAYLTVDRPESLNAMTAGMRQFSADFVLKANVDDEVEVRVTRGAGDNIGVGDDLPERADMSAGTAKDVSLPHEFGVPDLKYSP